MLACLYVCVLCICVCMCVRVRTCTHIWEYIGVSPQEHLSPPLTQCFSLAWSSPVGLADWTVNTRDPTVSIRLSRAGLKTLLYLLGMLMWVVAELWPSCLNVKCFMEGTTLPAPVIYLQLKNGTHWVAIPWVNLMPSEKSSSASAHHQFWS